MFGFHVSSLSNNAILNFQCVLGHAGILGNKHADSFRKTGASLTTSMVPCPSPQLLPKLVTHSMTNGDVTFPHSSSHFNCFIATVFLEELFLSRPICFELSDLASKVIISYYCSKSVLRKNSSCSQGCKS